mmetsp:Transcript_3094/g.5533  ORF Transcript_3094/g.5533 Transcript_3094/m.5533 type:complete len:83 (-) Transcript_3094:4-252(-)
MTSCSSQYNGVLIQASGCDGLRFNRGSKLAFQPLILENIFRLHCIYSKSTIKKLACSEVEKILAGVSDHHEEYVMSNFDKIK